MVDRDLNALVADYLYTEGYLDAATEFAREANLDVAESVPILESIRARRDIRACVQRGEIEHALDQVVELDPEVSFPFPSFFPSPPPKIDSVLCTTLSLPAFARVEGDLTFGRNLVWNSEVVMTS